VALLQKGLPPSSKGRANRLGTMVTAAWRLKGLIYNIFSNIS
jgi:hypothetical protein